MKSSIRLSIPQPCHESWNNMTPADKGRFCLSCQQTVTDFTKMSDKEIIELLQSKQASTCGRFLPDQLNKMLNIPASKKRHKPFISIAAIAAALTITMPFAKAAEFPEKTQYVIDNEDKQTIAIFSKQDTARFISGEVVDKEGRILQGATIMIKNKRIGTATNVQGKFSLRIPDNFKKKVIVLEVSSIGYGKKTIKVSINQELTPLKIELEDEVTWLGEIAIHFETDSQKKASLWTKVADTVRNFFV